MSKPLSGALSGVVTLLLGAAPAFGQSAQVTGRVADSSGGIMPGVTVSARNAATGLVRTEVTDAEGNYRLIALPIPGPYTVAAEIAGFGTEARQDLLLAIGQTVTLNFVLKPSTLAENITVTGDAPLVDTTRATPQTAITTQQIQDLPVAARRWIDMAMLTPGASQDNIRGQFYRGNVSVGAGVTNFFSTRSEVDGVTNNWIGHGEMRQNFPMDGIEQFNVSLASYKAESAMGTGGVVSVVTKSGTNDLQLSGFLFYRDDAITARQYFEASKPAYSRVQAGGTIGGPAVKDRLHYFFTYERTDEDVYNSVSTPAWPQYSGTYLSKQYRWTYLGRSDLQLTGQQSLFARFAQEYEYRPELTVGGSTIPSASFDFAVPRVSLVAGHTWILNSQGLNEFRFQNARAKYEVSPPGSHGSWDAGYFGPDRFSTCTDAFRYPSLSVGGCGSSQMGPEHRVEVKNAYSHQLASHQLKAGGDFSWVPYTHDSANTIGTWTFPLDRPYDANDPATHPTQYTQSLPVLAKLPSWQYGLFVQDDWRPLNNLTFNLGLRFDYQHCAYGDCLDEHLEHTAEGLGPEFRHYPIPVPFIDVEARGKGRNFSPRIGVAWDPFQSGRTNVHASFGKYYDFQRIFLLPNEITWHQSQQIIINRPSFPDPLRGLSRSAFLSTAPPNISVNSNSLRNPYSYPLVVGISQELPMGIGLTADVTVVNRNSDVDNIDINLPDPVTRVRPYPQFGRVTIQEPSSQTQYRALLVKLDKRLANRWSALVSYTLASARDLPMSNGRGDTYGYVRENGYSTADRRQTLRVSSTLQLPWDAQVSAILDLRSSQPFNATTTRDINGDGYTGDRPAGVGFRSGCRDLDLNAVNAYRVASRLAPVDSVVCPGFQNLDVRFSKFLPIGQHRLELMAQLFNVTNHANFAPATSNILSATFGQVNQIQPYINAPSRQAEIAIRYRF